MRNMKHCAAIIGLMLVALTAFASAQANVSKLEGSKPYSPTRLEWLAVELNAGNRVELSEEWLYSINFIPLEKEDTILIYVVYLPNVNRKIMNDAIKTAREVIMIKAKSNGWSSWLKIKEQVQMPDGK